MNRKLFLIDPVLFKKLNVHLLPLLFMLILGEILHGTSAASVLPDVPYATQHYEEGVSTLHDLYEALSRRIEDIWIYEQKGIKNPHQFR
ncbi:hypothetical protein GE605_19440 [Salmonella enterica]|nr:hypothetical protein [Salmonella enterica subsp. enterica serovar Infantis]